ncbi:MAG: sugar ABC transporter substrate-binding protein [Actinobacteria bacterium]|nr:sugar ABC transporter substrate-binding protein [Actinomycetota bacterium]
MKRLSTTTVAVVAMLAVAALALAACGSSSDNTGSDSGSSGSGEEIQVVAILPEANNSGFTAEAAGLEEEAKALGNVSLNVKFGTSVIDSEPMIKAIENAAVSGADVVAVNPGGVGDQLVPALEAAKAQGVKVVTFDQDVPGQSEAFIGFDLKKAGQLAAEGLGQMLPAGGQIAVIEAGPGNPVLDTINKSMKAALPSNIDVVADLGGVNSPEKGTTAAENALAAHPGLAGFYGDTDVFATVGIRAALASKGKDLAVQGMFGSEEAYEAIAKGCKCATVEQNYRELGNLAVQVSDKLGSGESVGSTSEVQPVLIITPEAAEKALTNLTGKGKEG